MNVEDDKLEKLKFPIERFVVQDTYDKQCREDALQALIDLPDQLENVLKDMSDSQIDTNYRPGGWTVRQLIHHIADSHMNCLIRFKLALTETNPNIKPYDQAAWAEMKDATSIDPQVSLVMINSIHKRLVCVIKNMKEEEFKWTLHHPEWNKDLSLDIMLSLYGWHSQHHLAHITGLKERNAWD